MRYQLWTNTEVEWYWIVDTKVNKRNIMQPIRLVERLFIPENSICTSEIDFLPGDIIVAEADTLEDLKLSVPWLFL